MTLSRKRYLIYLLFVIAASSILVRILMEYHFHRSALLYVGGPFLLSLLVLIGRRRDVMPASWKKRYWNIFRDATIVMLATSVVLFEGFLCVAFFMPIFYLFLLMAFIVEYAWRRRHDNKINKVSAYLLPAIVMAMAMEGAAPGFHFQRTNTVSASKVVDLSVAQIMNNLEKPIEFSGSPGGLLALFPSPYYVKAGSLEAGDIHEIYYRYHRWFITNTHEGSARLKIAEVGNDYVRTEFLSDNSYLSSYIELKGTHIKLNAMDEDTTEIVLSVEYERTLDPAWYFHPITRHGVRQMGAYLIDEIMVRSD